VIIEKRIVFLSNLNIDRSRLLPSAPRLDHDPRGFSSAQQDCRIALRRTTIFAAALHETATGVAVPQQNGCGCYVFYFVAVPARSPPGHPTAS
jgi:hypothetical protein